MSSFSISRQPYYVGAAVYSGFSGFAAMVHNSIATGAESDFQLSVICLSVILGAMAVIYLAMSFEGQNDDSDVHFGGGVTLHKSWWYMGLLALAAYRIVEGYKHNHDATGIESVYGMVWIVASLILGLFTWANYKSYTKG